MSGSDTRWAAVVGQKSVRGHPERHAAQEGREMSQTRGDGAALEAARRAPPAELPHEQAEIERARVDEQPFENVRMPAQVGAAHGPGVVDVRKGALQILSPAPQQPRAAPPGDAPPIAIDRALRVEGMPPVAATA